MNTSLITVSTLDSIQLAPTSEAVAKRDELLALARKGTCVKTSDSAERATEVLRQLTTFVRTVEASRKDACTGPMLATVPLPSSALCSHPLPNKLTTRPPTPTMMGGQLSPTETSGQRGE